MSDLRIVRKNKLAYYVESYFRSICSTKMSADRRIEQLSKNLNEEEKRLVRERVAYYCAKSRNWEDSQAMIKHLKKARTPKSYYFDTYEYARFFDGEEPIDFVFGDVIHIPERPSIVKSRPIVEGNENSILLNLDKVRHFVWVENDQSFSEKKAMLIGRGAVYQQNRIDFYEKYFHHPWCDLGQTNQRGGNALWQKPKMNLAQHLDYKFILSLQGNDVATNLKWIMSSNSIAVMPNPTVETWFMEGKLVGGVHYIEIKPDFSDVEDKLRFYIENEDECMKIIENAHLHCQQFFQQEVEDLCSLLVLKKYLYGDDFSEIGL